MRIVKRCCLVEKKKEQKGPPEPAQTKDTCGLDWAHPMVCAHPQGTGKCNNFTSRMKVFSSSFITRLKITFLSSAAELLSSPYAPDEQMRETKRNHHPASLQKYEARLNRALPTKDTREDNFRRLGRRNRKALHVEYNNRNSISCRS